MNLQLNLSVADGLKSQSQIARRITEDWAERNLFCLACSSEELVADKPSTPVHDFTCPVCETSYQLKSKNGRHGNVITNSAYCPKIAAIRQGTAPNYAFLDYSRKELLVTNLFVVPGHFLTESVIQKRPPLRPDARRAGWVGSNILLSKLPSEGRIDVVPGAAYPRASHPGTGCAASCVRSGAGSATRSGWRRWNRCSARSSRAGASGSSCCGAWRKLTANGRSSAPATTC